ncbi:hypothetical protein ACGFRB_13545 [Streptomyces sp. NPDC048718]|uniref:pPIWI_RE_Y domain-containing protein n=1 Tax=Streptomyces sp. NPDC048718 TaxID=3365587 RepID=UPI003711CD66
MRAGPRPGARADGGAGRGGTGSTGAGLELFGDVARAVAALAEVGSLRSFALPYPVQAQRALDRVVMRCLGIGESPPRSLPELWEWCRRRTAADPLFDVPASLVTPDATLVHPVGLMPTRTCLEAASQGPSGGVPEEARALLAELERRCGSVERFRRCRRFLARRPVVRQEDRRTRGWSTSVWSEVKDLYQPLPESLITGGVFLRCPSCGLPASTSFREAPPSGRSRAGEEVWCEGEDCPRDDELELIRDPARALVLRRSLRVCLALPYRTEEAALAELDRAGVGYEAVPGALSAYRVRHAGAATCEVRVYDRTQPGLLAARLSDGPPLAERTVVVVPRRLTEREGYRDRFLAALPPLLRERLVLTTPAELVDHLRAPRATADAPGPRHGGVPVPTTGEENDDT